MGYLIIEGSCINNQRVVIERPDKNSPLVIEDKKDIEEIIKLYSANCIDDEVNFVSNEIELAIKEDKLRPDDIMVICLDDRNARTYFSKLESKLYEKEIYSHNLSSNAYEKGFLEDNCVTLTTVYKAKGNETAMVLLIGCDVFERDKDNIQMRNKIFTAMTRAKAWLRISGCNIENRALFKEIKKVKENDFRLDFIYKDENMIKRDLNQIHSKRSLIRENLTETILRLKKAGCTEQEILEEIKRVGL